MKQIALTSENAGDVFADVEEAIRRGGIAIIPTDTVYGIIADAKNESAIKKVFAVKKRPDEKAFPVFIGSARDARRWAYISDQKAEFLDHVWPGQITVIFQKKGYLPSVLTGGKETLGIRVPDSAFLLKLLSFFDFPLLQTSANISSEPAACTPEEVLRYFDAAADDIDLFVSAGALSGTPSTVIDFTSDHPILLRSGLVTKSELDRFLGL
ncbi:MAG: threonylcarbamoyl-AMP synthase [Candidatus Sungbacteria bacterium RIFCSPHIGHO2_01_FULL_50_25]|uniref:L-threonylcarbamoyladenylate synthase n=1 Tax=Candidatus Sungbacteria bacterium RIFCSPHIGHO2_01_FULL_50_25 TaxID=1802265 RepID=A0A1G2KCR0_9BACT|nr:MAG: threonylcarbamoyl-AMP synthase [Candidatus Sungbacteria bacterium RIFCSPHIGHO2_01_FULL_50_25]